MWKLSPELEEDVSQLYTAMRRPKLLGSRTACRIIEDLAAHNDPAVIPAIASGLISSSKAVHEVASEQRIEIQAAIDDSKTKFDRRFLRDLDFWLSFYGFDVC